MAKSKKKQIEEIAVDILSVQTQIKVLGDKLVAFGGSKATRTKLLIDYTWFINENKRLQDKRAVLQRPWWERL